MSDPVLICPACGRPRLAHEVEITLAPMERRLYQIVEQAGSVGITNPRCVAQLYAQHRDGGPKSGNIIAVMTNHLNRKLVPFGVAIRSKGGPGAVYRLVKVK
jgi:hypothetical protein